MEAVPVAGLLFIVEAFVGSTQVQLRCGGTASFALQAVMGSLAGLEDNGKISMVALFQLFDSAPFLSCGKPRLSCHCCRL